MSVMRFKKVLPATIRKKQNIIKGTILYISETEIFTTQSQRRNQLQIQLKKKKNLVLFLGLIIIEIRNT